MADRKRTTKKVTPPHPRKRSVVPEEPQSQPEKKSIIPDFLRFGESYSSLVLGIIVVIAAASLLVSFARTGLPKQQEQDTSSTKTQALPTEGNVAKPGKIYTVTEGDDLWKVAEKAYGDGNLWQKVAEANNLVNPSDLSVGTRLTIPLIGEQTHLAVSITPTTAATATPVMTSTATPTRPSQPTVNPTIIATATVKPTMTPAKEQIVTATVVPLKTPTVSPGAPGNGPPSLSAGKSYTVVAGDTLWDISVRAYGTGYRWVEIAQANHWQNPDLIYPGNVFQLPK
jgi:nucleoid-associated protein YgaU